MQFITRGGLDVTNYIQKKYTDLWTFNPGSYSAVEGATPENGSYAETSYRTSQVDANFLLNADYTFGKDWSLHGVAGLNVNQRTGSKLAGILSGVAIEEWASFMNTSGATPTASSEITKRRLMGVFAQADFGWRNSVYLTVSARND